MTAPDATTRDDRAGRRQRWGIASLQLVSLFALLSAAYLPFRSNFELPHVPLTEDGYYLLTVARNLALGKGLTIDGTHLTNGFQPLFTFLCAPLYALAGTDHYTPLRLVLGLGGLLLLGTALLMGQVARDLLPGSRSDTNESKSEAAWVFALAVAFYVTSSAFRLHFNGMETGLVLFLLAYTWRFYGRSSLETSRQHVALGALLGLCVLARNDVVFLTILVAVARFTAASDRRTGLRNFLAVGLTAFLVSSPWWIYNAVAFGDLMPTSGRAQQYRVLSPSRMEFSFAQWIRQALPWFYPYGLPGRAILATQAGVLALSFYLLRRKHRSLVPVKQASDPSQRSRRSFEFGTILTLFSLLLVLWYGVTSGAVWHYFRYFAPVLLVGVASVSLLIARPLAKRPLLGPVFSAVLLLAVPDFVTTVCASEFPWSELGTNGYYKNQVSLVRDHVPPGEPVAASQSGTLGYFIDGVVNLDGKVNDEILDHAAGPVDYLEQTGIRWYCDARRTVPRFLRKGAWRMVERRFDFVLYERRPEPTPKKQTPR